MTKATIAGLVAFINAQPATRAVDHTGWRTCAVGDYGREVLNRQVTDGSVAESPTVPLELFQEIGTVQRGGSRWGVPVATKWTLMDELRCANKGRSSYGQLRLALAEQFPEMGFSNKPSSPFERIKARLAELVG